MRKRLARPFFPILAVALAGCSDAASSREGTDPGSTATAGDGGANSSAGSGAACTARTTSCLADQTFAELFTFDALACPCRFESEGQAGLDACLAELQGQSVQFESCLKSILAANSSPTLISELECELEGYRSRNQCVSDAGCGPVAWACELPACDAPILDSLGAQMEAECGR